MSSLFIPVVSSGRISGILSLFRPGFLFIFPCHSVLFLLSGNGWKNNYIYPPTFSFPWHVSFYVDAYMRRRRTRDSLSMLYVCFMCSKIHSYHIFTVYLNMRRFFSGRAP
ncbi:hypothetical protein DM02DRAFT_104267 [Periconia macrospinosa]|uniref:Uncharacterized protein n=1 Tax=Periconia macrospinosa TaxID=97972 RepID=A0A2V1DF87_9PLEO|nr:hypothetical protein DM02DRAFT_104267 [Periconia macrospinosa]